MDSIYSIYFLENNYWFNYGCVSLGRIYRIKTSERFMVCCIAIANQNYFNDFNVLIVIVNSLFLISICLKRSMIDTVTQF